MFKPRLRDHGPAAGRHRADRRPRASAASRPRRQRARRGPVGRAAPGGRRGRPATDGGRGRTARAERRAGQGAGRRLRRRDLLSGPHCQRAGDVRAATRPRQPVGREGVPGGPELRPAQPVKLILMSSVSVHRPGGLDTRRGRFESGGRLAAAWPGSSGEGQPARRGLPPRCRRGRRPVRPVGGRPPRHADGGRRHGVRATRGPRGQPVPPRRDEHGQRRALHVRAGDGRAKRGRRGRASCL